jgi:hypothetical protein
MAEWARWQGQPYMSGGTPPTAKQAAEALLDVRCTVHGRMAYRPEFGPFIDFVSVQSEGGVITYDTRAGRVPARWECHGFDGEGCDSFIRDDQAIRLARGKQPEFGVCWRGDVSARFRG